MKVTCIKKEGFLLYRNSVKEGRDIKTTHQGLKVNSIYDVFGIVIFQEEILYLIYDEYKMPMWYSATLFEITDNRMPTNWHYQFWGYDDKGFTSICGYRELVESKEHYTGLLERYKEDNDIFLKANAISI